MQKYTEGPLEIRPFTRVDFAIAQVGKLPHAVVFPIGAKCPEDAAKATPEQIALAKADATLYAASPALLDAVRLVEEAWSGSGDMAAAVDACLLAIALAEVK